MNIVKRDNSRMPSFFDNFLNRNLFNGSSFLYEGNILPKVNVVETDREFKVEVAAPGMRKEDFKVELNNNRLTISSERTHHVEEGADHSKFSRREFSYASFSRSFYLPDTVEADKIKAKYKDGLLRIIIPKKKGKQKPVKTIRIS